jgi:hypothetical protein
METAMQQHIEWLKATLDLCKENAPTLVNCISLCISDAESRLEMEKEQIKNAFEIGYDNGACVQEGNAIYHGSNYYNETFKSE